MNNNEFLIRQLDLIQQKQSDPTIEWKDITKFRQDNLHIGESRDTTRKGAKLLMEYLNSGWSITPPDSSSIVSAPIEDFDVRKERIKLQTEKLEFNKWLREYSRDELIAEHIVEAIDKLEPLNLPRVILPSRSNRDYLLTISDAHYGVEFKIKDLYGATINEYSPEIFENRMWELMGFVIEQVKANEINTLHIFDLGDDLDGLLRANSQLMNLRYGVIDSSILYANFLANWLNELSKFVRIKFQMTKKSNHNQLRLVGQPKNAFPDEDMSKSMLVFIKERLKSNPNITIIENPTGLAYAQLATYAVLGGHFETKNLGETLKDYSVTYKIPLDYVFSGHWHSSFSGEIGIDSEYISVRSLIGVNPYSMSINKTAKAGASLFTFELGRGLTCEQKYTF